MVFYVFYLQSNVFNIYATSYRAGLQECRERPHPKYFNSFWVLQVSCPAVLLYKTVCRLLYGFTI